MWAWSAASLNAFRQPGGKPSEGTDKLVVDTLLVVVIGEIEVVIGLKVVVDLEVVVDEKNEVGTVDVVLEFILY